MHVLQKLQKQQKRLVKPIDAWTFHTRSLNVQEALLLERYQCTPTISLVVQLVKVRLHDPAVHDSDILQLTFEELMIVIDHMVKAASVSISMETMVNDAHRVPRES